MILHVTTQLNPKLVSLGQVIAKSLLITSKYGITVRTRANHPAPLKIQLVTRYLRARDISDFLIDGIPFLR